MPFIRGSYAINPATGVPGYWIEPTGSPPDTYVGISQAQIDALRPSGTVTAAKAQAFRAAVLAALQSAVAATTLADPRAQAILGSLQFSISGVGSRAAASGASLAISVVVS